MCISHTSSYNFHKVISLSAYHVFFKTMWRPISALPFAALHQQIFTADIYKEMFKNNFF